MDTQCCEKHCGRHFAALIGRVIIGAIFVLAAVYKYFHWETSVADVTAAGLPYPALFLAVGALLELIGGLSLILGYKTRVGAWLLIVFIVPVTLIFHSFWAVAPEHAILAEQDFIRNVFYFGALLLLVANGPGRISIDAACCSKSCGTSCK